MGVQGFQEFLEKRCPGAVVPVDLLKLARTVARQQHRAGYPPPPPPPTQPPAPGAPPPCRVLVDADSALQRLYGGYQTDWVCGGQWNAMLGYLAALSQACLYQGGLELVAIFNGTLAKERLPEWARRAQGERQTAQLIVSHIGNKGTPPPRAWFLPPACLAHCIRLAMIRFRVKVFQSLEDHHLEVVSFFRENGFHGLIAHDSEYALCNIPSYYSSHALKLSWNGKNLTTNQFLMQEVAKQLGLKMSNFPIFAALLGNHILPDEDLAAFHWSLLGPDHPLASLKVRAHQLVLPPCDVVIKAVSEYVATIKDASNLDTVGKDIFRHSQSRTDDKIERFKKAVEYYSVATKQRPPQMNPSPFVVAGYPHNQFGVPPIHHNHMGGMPVGKPMFSHHMPPKLPYQHHPFPPGPNSGFVFPPHPMGDLSHFHDDNFLKAGPFSSWSIPYDTNAAKFPNHLTLKPSPSSGHNSSPSSSSDEDQNSAASK